MEHTELTSLIKIREYVVNAIQFPTTSKEISGKLSDTLLMLDKKIIAMLTNYEFETYIGMDGAKEAKQEAAELTNIYFGRPALSRPPKS